MKNQIAKGCDPEYYFGVIDAVGAVAELLNMDVPIVSALKTVLEEQQTQAEDVLGKTTSEEMLRKVTDEVRGE